MSILVGRETRLVVQGITGREGEFHARAMAEYGTRDRRRRHAGQGRPDGARRARPRVRHRAPRRSARPAPTPRASSSRPPARPDAVLEAASAGIATIFCITEGIPALDMVPARRAGPARRRAPHRAELPGRDVARSGQGRDHPGLGPPRGPGRRRQPLRARSPTRPSRP